MSQHAVAAYHDGLDDGLARESSEWLTARQRDIGLTFGERPLCTVIRPRFLSPAEYDTLRTASASLLGAFRHAGAMAQDDAAFRAQFRLADWEEQLLATAPRLHVAAPLSRLDAFIDPVSGIARITEYNGETPAGTGYTDALAELFLALPAMRPFLEHWVVRPLPAMGHVHNVLLESWHRFRGVRTVPSIAIVDWDDVPTQAEFRICLDYFRAMGVPCRITTPEALRYEGGKLKDADGTVIDLIYKRVLLHELIAEGGLEHPMVRAVADGAVCMVNPFACKPLHKKASLAVLSDERNAGRFSGAEQAAIATHVPWTRVVEERKTVIDGTAIDLLPWMLRERESLVLKPNDDYGGTGIVLGWEVDDTTWHDAVARAVAEPYVVQRRIALPSEPFPAIHEGALHVEDRIVDTAPFCWHGAFMDGCLTRISTSTLVNVTAGGGSTIPTFVVEPR
jgi:hypothetical protein